MGQVSTSLRYERNQMSKMEGIGGVMLWCGYVLGNVRAASHGRWLRGEREEGGEAIRPASIDVKGGVAGEGIRARGCGRRLEEEVDEVSALDRLREVRSVEAFLEIRGLEILGREIEALGVQSLFQSFHVLEVPKIVDRRCKEGWWTVWSSLRAARVGRTFEEIGGER